MHHNDEEQTALVEIGFGTSFEAEICDMLEGVDQFRAYTSTQLEHLVKFMRAYQAAPGTVIVSEGKREHVGDVYWLISGRLEIFKDAHSHDARLLAAVMPGRSVGEVSLIDGMPHSATVIAAEASTLVLLTKNNFLRITEAFPQLGTKLLWQLALLLSARLRKTSGDLVDHLHD